MENNYEQLVKSLRMCSSELNCGDCPLLYRDSCSSDELMNDAAVAIETLTRQVKNLERALRRDGAWQNTQN